MKGERRLVLVGIARDDSRELAVKSGAVRGMFAGHCFLDRIGQCPGLCRATSTTAADADDGVASEVLRGEKKDYG